tara:strand:+ start:5157 stop:5771 length:615 start_codon:yes stop_codon:yes gene_type:complete
MTISILDYNMGNISSVFRALSKNNIECKVIRTYDEIISADKIILPGVGHFGKAMDYLRNNNLDEALHKSVLVDKKPILGICLGMQLMCQSSEEGGASGLGWFDASITKIQVKDRLKYKIPHISWNHAIAPNENKILKGIHSDAEFYFVHSYYVSDTTENEVLCKTTFESEFISALSKDNIYGVQFHPEKSHESGFILLKNFAEL